MEKFTPPAGFNRLYYSLGVLMLLGALDTSIVATALPNIVSDFKSTQNISWVIVGYSLAAASALPVFGKLVDKFGSAKLFGWALALGHARSGDAAMIAGYCGQSDGLNEALYAFAKSYARQNMKDYEQFCKAVKSGKLKAAKKKTAL